MICRLVICAFFSLLSVLHAAPIPSPNLSHGDYVSVKPNAALNRTPQSSDRGHPGVVVGGPDQHNHYQVAVISHNPPDTHHENLHTVHPGSTLNDAANSRIGTGKPMNFHASDVKHLDKLPSLSHTETSDLQRKIQTNSGHATWPAHNPGPVPHTIGGVAHAVMAANSLRNRISSPPPAGPSLLQRIAPAPHNPPATGHQVGGGATTNRQANRQAKRFNPMSGDRGKRRGGGP